MIALVAGEVEELLSTARIAFRIKACTLIPFLHAIHSPTMRSRIASFNG
jgi:hypothetical protein